MHWCIFYVWFWRQWKPRWSYLIVTSLLFNPSQDHRHQNRYFLFVSLDWKVLPMFIDSIPLPTQLIPFVRTTSIESLHLSSLSLSLNFWNLCLFEKKEDWLRIAQCFSQFGSHHFVGFRSIPRLNPTKSVASTIFAISPFVLRLGSHLYVVPFFIVYTRIVRFIRYWFLSL